MRISNLNHLVTYCREHIRCWDIKKCWDNYNNVCFSHKGDCTVLQEKRLNCTRLQRSSVKCSHLFAPINVQYFIWHYLLILFTWIDSCIIWSLTTFSATFSLLNLFFIFNVYISLHLHTCTLVLKHNLAHSYCFINVFNCLIS